MNDESYKGKAPIFNELLCPIMQTIMTDPVMADDGYTYERKNITEWLKKKDTSPLTREKISKNLIYNQTIASLLKNNYSYEVKNQIKTQEEDAYQEKLSKRLELIKSEYLANSQSDKFITVLVDSHYELPLYIVYTLTSKKNRSDYFKCLSFSSIPELKEVIPYFEPKKLDVFFKNMTSPKELKKFISLYWEFRNIRDNEHISFKKSQLLDFNHKITINLMAFFLKEAPKTIKDFFKKTKLSYEDLKTWPTDNDGIALLDNFITYKSKVIDLVSYGMSIDDFKQLKDFKPGFRKRILDSKNGDWKAFRPLIEKNGAGIPWNKWMALWKEEKDNKQYNGVTFNKIIQNEKENQYKIINNQKGDKCQFNFVIENIKNAFCGQSKELHEHFYDKLTIQNLWDFYTGLLINDTDRQTLSDDSPESKQIYYLLKNEKYTPKQIIITLTNDLKQKYQNTENLKKCNVTLDYVKKLLLEPEIIKQETDYYHKFNVFIDFVSIAFCQKDNKLLKHFYDDVSIQNLWDFYITVLTNQNDYNYLINEGKDTSKHIHYLLKSEIYTPEQIIRQLTDDLKGKYKKNENLKKCNITLNYLEKLLGKRLIKKETDAYENLTENQYNELNPSPQNGVPLFDANKVKINDIPESYNKPIINQNAAFNQREASPYQDDITGVKYDSNPLKTNDTESLLEDKEYDEYSQANNSIQYDCVTQESCSNIKSNQSIDVNSRGKKIILFCFLSGWAVLAIEGICEYFQTPIKSSLMQPPIKSSTLLVLLGAGTALLVLGKLIQCCTRPPSNASNTTDSIISMGLFTFGVIVMVSGIGYGMYHTMNQLNYNLSNDSIEMILITSAIILLAVSFLLQGKQKFSSPHVDNNIENYSIRESSILKV